MWILTDRTSSLAKMPQVQIIDLISSSPSSKAPLTSVKTCTGRETKRSAIGFRGIVPFSDDIDATVTFGLLEQHGNWNGHKRRRLVAEETNTRARPQTQATGVIANPHGSPPRQSTPGTTVCNDDPFASSPRLAGEESGPESNLPKARRPRPPQRSRTHAPRATPSRKLISLESLSSDPFCSSPPCHEQNPSCRQRWDPISSSAPQPLKPSQETSTFAKDVGDDGDNNSVLDSSDELPDPGTLSRLGMGGHMAQRGEGLQVPRREVRGSALHTALAESMDHGVPILKNVHICSTGKASGYTAHSRDARNARKQLEHEAKSHERKRVATLVEANKVKSTDKKSTTREMVIIFPTDLEPTLALQTQASLTEAGVEVWTAGDSMNVIKWKRKVTSEFNQELRGWEPVPPRLEDERFGLVILTAEQFVAKVADKDHGLAWQTSQLKEQLPGYQIIYLLQGITPWIRKARTLHNRQFASAVRNSGDVTIPFHHPAADISEESIEDALVHLQLVYDTVLIHHTDTSAETAHWVTILTQHVSTTRYRNHHGAGAGIGFCIDPGQVRSGEDKRDTYVRLLQEIARITTPVACGIVAEYDTVTKLVCELRRSGPLALENLKRRDKDGIESDRTVGQAASRRVHSILTSLNEASTRV